ncbi:hypothetical protein D3C72_2290480 [compost metagenome]
MGCQAVTFKLVKDEDKFQKIVEKNKMCVELTEENAQFTNLRVCFEVVSAHKQYRKQNVQRLYNKWMKEYEYSSEANIVFNDLYRIGKTGIYYIYIPQI